eukprot:TRINITY_DN96876_c0_g1_i1.p1 TRINITY_DN96876_c0_g1~~TRINITY_DN96876_c0_g1_i1.p1  ORF type:complete len:776 (-),score=148.73 TRINITY_DN96876_c0_g1_i1:82-2409(-)
MTTNSFGLYEPSESMLQALQAKVGAKNLAERLSEKSEPERKPDPVHAPNLPPPGPGLFNAGGEVSIPSFSLKGGLRERNKKDEVLAQEIPGYEVATGSGMSFKTKEAEGNWAQGETRDASYQGPGLPAPGAGALFRISGAGGALSGTAIFEEVPELATESPPSAFPAAVPPPVPQRDSKNGNSNKQRRGTKPAPRAASHGPELQRHPSASSRGHSPSAAYGRGAALRQQGQPIPEINEIYGGSGGGATGSARGPIGSARGPHPLQQASTPSSNRGEGGGPSRPSTAGRASASAAGRPPSGYGASVRPSSSGPGSGNSGTKSMQNAADEAFARIMAHADGGLNLDALLEEEATREDESLLQCQYSPGRGSVAESQVSIRFGKLPTAVTVAGVPVASDGDLVYLGGGLFASAAPPPVREAPKPKPRAKPRQLRPTGPRSAIRSASAHLVGPQSRASAGAGDNDGDNSPAPSRAQSDGNLGLGRLPPAGSGHRAGSGNDSARGAPQGSVAGSVASNAPRVWRPSGVQKLPPAKLEPPPKRLQRSDEDEGQMPGAHSEARFNDRNNQWKEGFKLFGQQGLLNQLKELDAAEHSRLGKSSSDGPPQNGVRRQEERKAAKEARIQQMLEERALRLATEAAIAAEKKKKAALSMQRHHSAPDFTKHGLVGLAGQCAEDVEQQKRRVASKMQILDFFNGYKSAVGKMTADQTKILLSKLHTQADEATLSQAMSQFQQQTDETLQEFTENFNDVESEQSIQGRLRQVNDFCNKVFEDQSASVDV